MGLESAVRVGHTPPAAVKVGVLLQIVWIAVTKRAICQEKERGRGRDLCTEGTSDGAGKCCQLILDVAAVHTQWGTHLLLLSRCVHVCACMHVYCLACVNN